MGRGYGSVEKAFYPQRVCRGCILTVSKPRVVTLEQGEEKAIQASVVIRSTEASRFTLSSAPFRKSIESFAIRPDACENDGITLTQPKTASPSRALRRVDDSSQIHTVLTPERGLTRGSEIKHPLQYRRDGASCISPWLPMPISDGYAEDTGLCTREGCICGSTGICTFCCACCCG